MKSALPSLLKILESSGSNVTPARLNRCVEMDGKWRMLPVLEATPKLYLPGALFPFGSSATISSASCWQVCNTSLHCEVFKTSSTTTKPLSWKILIASSSQRGILQETMKSATWSVEGGGTLSAKDFSLEHLGVRLLSSLPGSGFNSFSRKLPSPCPVGIEHAKGAIPSHVPVDIWAFLLRRNVIQVLASVSQSLGN